MTPENFCYWLRGILEIQQAGLDKNEKRSVKLTEAQLEMISEHLGLVFAPRLSDSAPATGSGGSTASILEQALRSETPHHSRTLIC